METQADYLGKKGKWSRKLVLITDGENPLEADCWEETADKLRDYNVSTYIV